MFVEKGDLINARDLREYLAEKNGVQLMRYDIGNRFVSAGLTREDKFWIRSDPTVYSGAVWVIGSTYSEGTLVERNAISWRSLQDSNTGNTPAEGSWWTKVATLDSLSGDWTNFEAHFWGWNSFYREYWLYKWNETTNVWDLIYHLPFAWGHAVVGRHTLSPGRYKLKGTIGVAGGWMGTVAYQGVGKQWDTTFTKDDKIRVMTDDYSELRLRGTTLITATRANAGELSHPGFLGGDEEGT